MGGINPITSLEDLLKQQQLINRLNAGRYTAPRVLPVQGQIPSSVVVGSGTASVDADGTVHFTAVSSLSLNGIFNGLGGDMYEYYFSAITSVDENNIIARFRAAGVDLNATNSYGATYFGYVSAASAGSTASLSAMYFSYGRNSWTLPSSARGLIDKPYTANGKTLHTFTYSPGFEGYDMGNYTSTATLFDGLTIFTTSGTMSGTFKVVKVS